MRRKILTALLLALLANVTTNSWSADSNSQQQPFPQFSDPVPAADNSQPGYMDNARELVMRALSMLGVNYKFGGSTPSAGFDCSGLVDHVFREVSGLILPRRSEAMSKVGDKVDKDVLQPGDLVFFNTRNKHPYSHVGIYIGDDRFVHAPSRGGQVEISNLDSRYWQKHYSGARRVTPPTP